MMFAALLAALSLQAAAPAPNVLTVVVEGVRSSEGHVRVDVCTSDQFLGAHCFASAAAPAQKGETVVTVPGVAPGLYAVQAYHDRNDNHAVDMGPLGIPKEDVGFSGIPKLGFHGPVFTRAAFTHGETPQAVSVRLNHFF